MSLVILLLAAGASSRMNGRDKLMEDVAGAPLLAVMARRAMPLGQVLVTLPALDHPRRDALQALPVTPLPVPDAAEGMAASIRAGVSALPDHTTGLMILPADMPDLTEADLRSLTTAWQTAPDRIHRATSADGTPGHPVIFPRSAFQDLRGLSGDTGARGLLRTAPVQFVALPGDHALTDLDTPEAWALWRARN